MKKLAGFSLVELIIAIAIMGILLSLGLPAFTTYINNAKLRAGAQSLLSGIQMARTEAVRRNANVTFLLTNDDYTVVGFAAVTPNTSGQNWLIRTSSLSEFIEAKFGAEGGGRQAAAGSPVQINGSLASITFSGLGSTSPAGGATFQVTNPAGGDCASAGGPMRCLNVVVSVGGQSRICDPAATAAGDTRGC
jgi:type IV fimbrial biogenesis protein FimT